jgi:hypothetical protein
VWGVKREKYEDRERRLWEATKPVAKARKIVGSGLTIA